MAAEAKSMSTISDTLAQTVQRRQTPAQSSVKPVHGVKLLRVTAATGPGHRGRRHIQ
jgi:hypothetical protein